jgi:serine protease
MMDTLIGKCTLIGLLLAGILLPGCGGGGGGGDNSGSNSSSAATDTLSGTIQAASSSAVDGDVNDPGAPFQTNNTPDTAQALPNPVILGGHANLPGAGSPGRTYDAGDQYDWYRVNLATDQTITLSIAGDGSSNDLDLKLFNADLQLVDASLGTGKFECLQVQQPGNYFLLVQAFSGASNYTLTIGQQSNLSTCSSQLSDAFVPGEVVVRFADKSPSGVQGSHARAQSLGLTARGGAEGRDMLLSLAGVERTSLYQTLGIAANARTPESGTFIDPTLQLKLDTLLAVKALRKRADVVYADLNYLRFANFVPNDEFYPWQWHYPLINLPQAWDLSIGTNTIVAVVDTGVVLSHPDLQGQLLPGYDFISDPANAGDGDGIDPNPDDPGDRTNPGETSSFHGTHVAGTVAAATNNGSGVAGVAFHSKIMPLRALGRFGGSVYDIEQAILYAAQLPNDSGTVPAHRADVVNLSLGGPGFSESEQAVYQQVRNAGVVIVAAAGNESSDIPSYPAAYNGVIAVSAVTLSKTLAPYSNFGAYIDVAAPGGDTDLDLNGDGKPDGVLSTAASDASGSIVPNYLFYQGTSMASPHVAGVVALMKAVNPGLSPLDIDNLLASGEITTDLGEPGRDDRFGYGLINAYSAVVAALEAVGTPVTPVPILSVNPAALNFGLFVNSFKINVSNGGGGNLQVDSFSQNSSGWLTITAPADSNGLGDYTISVNREGLADGVYTAAITFTSSTANSTVQVPVIMQVASLGASDLGQLYVLLADHKTGEVVAAVAAERQTTGTYSYRFSQVPQGDYVIFAGTDFNNDGTICDPGEACGAYLTLDNPVDVQVNGDRDDLNFTVGFSPSLTNTSSASAAARPVQGVSRDQQVNKRLAR